MSRRDTTTAVETAAGRRRQADAEAAVAGLAPRCGEERTYGSSSFTCVRPPHGGQHPSTDTWRRNAGEPVAADHHWFIPAAEATG